MSGINDLDKFVLSESQHESIFQKEIKPYLFKNANPVDSPIVVVFGGQPGAGKSMAVDLAQGELKEQGGAVSIVGDELRLFHPSNEDLMALDDKTAAFYTGQDMGKWVEKAINYAKQLGCHVIIEGTMRSPQVVERTIQTFKDAGYFIDARVLAVNERLSWQGVLQRYENQRFERGTGRMTLPDAHRAAYDGILRSLEKIEQGRLSDRIGVYSRGAVILYENHLEQGQWVSPPKARQAVENRA